MKFQKTIDAIQFFEQDYRQIIDFIFDYNLMFKVELDVHYSKKIESLNTVRVIEPIPDKVTLRIFDPVNGYVYFEQGDWLVVDSGEPKLVYDYDFRHQGWTKLEDQKQE